MGRTRPERSRPARAFFPYAALGAFAFLLRLLVWLDVRDLPLYRGLGLDALFYHRWAEQLASGDWLGREAFFMGPVYPYVLGALYALGFGPESARVAQCALGSVTVVLVAFLGRAAAGRRPGARAAGLTAGAMAAVYPPFLLYDLELLFPVVQTLLVALALLLLLRAGDRPAARRNWAGAGFVLGLAAVGNASVLAFAPPAALWAALRPGGRRLAPAGWLLAGVALAVLPVTARNAVVSGDFVLITSNGGLNFYIGNGAEASGAYVKPRGLDVERDPEGDLPAERALGRALRPSEVSRWWQDRALADVRRDPGRAARLWVRKLAYFWNDFEIPQIENFRFQRSFSPLLRAPAPTFGMLAALAAVALWRRRRDAAALAPLWLFPLVQSLVIAAFFVVGRYRISVVPALLALAGAGAVELARDARAGGAAGRNAAAGLGAAAALYALSLTNPFHVNPRSGFGQCHFRQGIELQRMGRMPEAEAEFRRAVELDPDYAPAYQNLGFACAARGDFEAALAAFETAVRLDPGYPRAQYNLGNVREDLGDLAGAWTAFARAAELDPGWAEPRGALARLAYRRGDLAAADSLAAVFAQLQRLEQGGGRAAP